MTQVTDPLASLKDKFRIKGDTVGWTLKCSKCPKLWALDRQPDGGVHTGNILHLLNHYASHAIGKKRAKQYKKEAEVGL